MSKRLDFFNSFAKLESKQWKFVANGLPENGVTLWVFGKKNIVELKKKFGKELTDWEVEQIKKGVQRVYSVTNAYGLHWIIFPGDQQASPYFEPAHLKSSDYAKYRDSVGSLSQANFFNFDMNFNLVFVGCKSEQVKGFLVGLNLLKYRFKKVLEPSSKDSFKVHVRCEKGPLKSADLQWAFEMALATNFCRHLVNVPPSFLNPENYVTILKNEFSRKEKFSFKIYDSKQLLAGGFELISAVGAAAATGPYIVHIKYRNGKVSQKPIAFVGKGITYDTGGLNIKPSTGMRLMKKDMGGSAAIAGLAYFVKKQKIKANFDFYFAIAENAVSEKSYKPGDILGSRDGKTVEIDNTDAEGRLALADAMALACEASGRDEAKAIIDVATLTGAIKVGLGASTAGMFCNSPQLEKQLVSSSHKSGEAVWPMPLDQKLRPSLSSPVADLVNSTNGFGGAVTAALFLESFVKGRSWAHFDIFAWTEGAQKALSETGASGQMVQCLAQFIAQRKS